MKLIGSQYVSEVEDLADMRRQEHIERCKDAQQAICDHDMEDGKCLECGLQLTLPSATAATEPRPDLANNPEARPLLG